MGLDPSSWVQMDVEVPLTTHACNPDVLFLGQTEPFAGSQEFETNSALKLHDLMHDSCFHVRKELQLHLGIQKEGRGIQLEETDAWLVKSNAEFPFHPASMSYIRKLMEALEAGHEILYALNCELEQERSAAATAANEAISTIFRLQKEKAVLEMEARHYEQLVEAKAFYDQETISSLKDTIFRQAADIAALDEELSNCRCMMLGRDLETAKELVKPFVVADLTKGDKTLDAGLTKEDKTLKPTSNTYCESECLLIDMSSETLQKGIRDIGRMEKSFETHESCLTMLGNGVISTQDNYPVKAKFQDNYEPNCEGADTFGVTENLHRLSQELSTLQQQILCLATDLSYSCMKDYHLSLGEDACYERSFIGQDACCYGRSFPHASSSLGASSDCVDTQSKYPFNFASSLDCRLPAIKKIKSRCSSTLETFEAKAPPKDLLCVLNCNKEQTVLIENEERHSVNDAISFEDVNMMSSLQWSLMEKIANCETRLQSFDASRSAMVEGLKIMKENIEKTDLLFMFASSLLKEFLCFTSLGGSILDLLCNLIRISKCHVDGLNGTNMEALLLRLEGHERGPRIMPHDALDIQEVGMKSPEPDVAFGDGVVSKLSLLWSNSLSWMSDERGRAETAFSGWDH